ncbi:hypothetical protein XENOCAPTIV_027250 [Xenoophorus captivus]|uniref:Uncharacterized protein n=1 Tax=Xenoophorus captivus TaxID=1517983 RepID=A0ABV0QXT7_9TELE
MLWSQFWMFTQLNSSKLTLSAFKIGNIIGSFNYSLPGPKNKHLILSKRITDYLLIDACLISNQKQTLRLNENNFKSKSARGINYFEQTYGHHKQIILYLSSG